MEDEKSCSCGCGGFPIFAIIVLLLGIGWLLKDLEIITFDIPWLPIVVIIVALGMLVKHCKK